jgi:hypothetical protein
MSKGKRMQIQVHEIDVERLTRENKIYKEGAQRAEHWLNECQERAEADRAAVVELARKLIGDIPKNWVDHLLSGPDAVIHNSPCPEIEALLNALRKRLQARADAFLRGERSSGKRKHTDLCLTTAYGLRCTCGADKAGEPGEGGERKAKEELLNALAVVTLLKLARGRMQHIVETAAAAMTHAEVRTTQDVIAQIDAAFDLKPQCGREEPEAPMESEWIPEGHICGDRSEP